MKRNYSVFYFFIFILIFIGVSCYYCLNSVVFAEAEDLHVDDIERESIINKLNNNGDSINLLDADAYNTQDEIVFINCVLNVDDIIDYIDISKSVRFLRCELLDDIHFVLCIIRVYVCEYDVINLEFSDGTNVEIIDEHAFFDLNLNKYVFLREDASQYIGHYFNKQEYDSNGNMIWIPVQLTNVTTEHQTTRVYSPVTYGHLCYYVNGMLSMPGNTESFINIFDVNPLTLMYDQESMQEDISTYGLYTYEEFDAIIPIPEDVFNAFNGQYLKIAIGKGLTTLDEIQSLLDRYMVFFE